MKKLFRRVLIVIIVLGVLVVVTLPFVPRILSSFAPGMIVDAIAPSVSGTVSVDSVALSWGGPQVVNGLRIVDAEGMEAVALDVDARASLLDLLSIESIDARVSGVVRSTWEEDGTFSIAGLLAPDDARAPDATKAAGSKSGGDTPGGSIPAVDIDCAALRVELDVRDGRDVPLIVEGLTGSASMIDGNVDVELASPVARGAEQGEIRIDAEVYDIVGRDGALTPSGATVDCTIGLKDIPVPFQDEAPNASGFVKFGSVDLAEKLEIDVLLAAELGAETGAEMGAEMEAGVTRSEFRADLVVSRPFDADGAPDIRPERIEGMLEGESIPAALLEPLLPGGFPLVIARDIGAELEATAIFGAGSPRDVDVNVAGEHLTVTMRGGLDGETGALTSGTLDATGALSPELIAAFGDIIATERMALVVRAERLAYPSFTALRDDPSLFEGEIEATLTGAAVVRTGSTAQPIEVALERVQFNASSDGAGMIEPMLRIRGDAIDGEVNASARLVRGDRIEIEDVRATLTTASEQLIEWLDLQDTDPRPQGRIAASLDAEPFAVERDADGAWMIAKENDARAIVTLDPLTMSAPQLSAPVDVREIRVQASRAADGATRARATAALASDGRGLGQFEADAKLEPGAGAPVGRLSLLALNVAGLERLLTMTSGTAVAWLGATGDVSVDLVRPDDTTWRVGLAFPEAEGVVVLKPGDDVLYVESEELTARLSPEVLGALVVASDEESAFELVAPLPVAVRIDGVALPWSLLSGEAFDPALLAGSIKLTGGPLALVTLDGLPVALDELTVALEASDIATGMPIRLSATMPDDGSGKAGSAVLDGRLVHLFDDEGLFTPALGRYSGDVTLAHVPTDLIDGLMDLQGKLVAAIGEAVDGSATASEFSQRTGWVDVDLTSPNGFVRGRIRGMEQGLRTAILEERQLHGALVLTPEFSHEVLGAMAPVFSDVYSTERPITFRFTANARLPHDGNPRLIHGDIDLDVGPVAFEPGGDLLGLLAMFGETTGTVAGRIEPTHFTIRKGVVSFSEIMVHLDKFSIPFSGTVDLATDAVAMRWQVPIEQLARTFHELEGLEGVMVPLVTKGTQGNIKTELAPEFGETLLEIGVRKGLEELLRGIGGGGG